MTLIGNKPANHVERMPTPNEIATAIHKALLADFMAHKDSGDTIPIRAGALIEDVIFSVGVAK